jgi:hypothetical protein
MMATCGIWMARAALCASAVDDDGKPLVTFPSPRNDEARWGLLVHLDAHHGLDCNLVITDDHARKDPVARLALQRGLAVWVAPWRTVVAVRAITGLQTGPPKRTATLLARMLLNPLFRAQLRRLQRDDRQLSLL